MSSAAEAAPAAADESSALAIEGLVAGYGGVIALDDVSLSAEAAAITAVLGANGAGKTTLLRAVSGMIRPRRGQILLGGATWPAATPSRWSGPGSRTCPRARASSPSSPSRKTCGSA